MMNEFEKGMVFNFEKLGCVGLARKLSVIFSESHVRSEELMGILTDTTSEEILRIKQERAERLLSYAHLKDTYANLDMLEYSPDRKLDKVLVERLSTCDFVREFANVVIIGAAGTGKTFLAKAFGVAACNEGHRTCIMHLRAILRDLAERESLDRKTYERRISYYARMPLLIIDEWMSIAPSKSDLVILHELIDARYGRSSTIICSQMAEENWPRFCGNIAIGQAIKGRITSHCYKIHLEGEDIRERHFERP